MPITTRNIIVSLLLIILSIHGLPARAQEGVPIEVTKPKKFEDKVLKSEKTGEKKFTLPRRFMNDLGTRDNFYFNAKNKYDAIIERAKESQRDDFNKLLSFYGYSLDNTANDKNELDSILLKCTAGILLHDLRNDWVDNLYLLIGKAYLLRKDFDSSGMTFQYINYNFHPSRKETDRVYIGSNNNGSDGSTNVVNKEKTDIFHKVFTNPPSRNDALLWQARNFIEQNQLINASALLSLMKTDVNFPARLNPFYNELQAYMFYKQEQWDSASIYFEKALDNADNRQDLARREYLLAQMLVKANKKQEASKYYNKASRHTTNLLMAIFADLNEAQLVRGNEEKDIRSTIDDLLKMARRDKYDAYRDLLYYSAAQLQIKIKDTAGAIKSYQKSIDKTIPPAFEYHNKSYLQLSDIAFSQKQYRHAASLIDSVQLADESMADKQEELEKRKQILHQIARRAGMVDKEDSLQKLAKLPEADLEAYLKKLVRRLRKEQGLKEEPVILTPINPAVTKFGGVNTTGDIFGGGGITDRSGEWYFYNAAAKARGFTEFKTKWGKRPNVDNWRRMGAVNSNLSSFAGGQGENKEDSAYDKSNGELTVDALKANIPFTPAQLKISNDTISSSLFDLGSIYENSLEDYNAAAEAYEQLYNRFPNDSNISATLFNLYYCYLKAGNKEKSDYYKHLLQNQHKESVYNKTITAYESGTSQTQKSPVTQKYEEIYDLMLSGKFDQALEEKKKVEEEYPNNKWNPQLLYIEAIYHIRNRHDSLANHVLDNIITNFPTSPLFEKAQTMKEVLAKRSEIENYLTNLQVTRNQEEEVIVPEEVKNLTTAKNQNNLDAKPKKPQVTAQQDKPKTIQPAKVEAKKDSVAVKPVEAVKAYVFNPQSQYLVLMILENVDGIYVNESRNAFNRYNSSYHGAQDIQVSGIKLNDTTAINIFTRFPDVLKATDYALELRDRTKQIVPWLKGGKYSYIIISAENLDLLKSRKDVAEYRRFLEQYLPGKF